jgi:putative ABC transport system permease protein
MSAGWRYVLRNLQRRRTRTAVGVLGIFLTLGLLTAVQIGLDSLSISYLDLVALQAGRADLVISRTGNDPFRPQPFDPGRVQELLKTNTAVLGLSPRWFGVVQVQLRGEEHYALLIGVDPQREQELGLSGFKPELELKGEACALSQPLSEKLKSKAGSKLSIRTPDGGADLYLEQTSTLERQMVVPQQVRDFVVVTETSARTLLGEPAGVHVLAGAFREPKQYYDARDLHQSVLRLKQGGASIAAALGMDYDVRLPKATAISGFQDFTSPLRAVFGVFALLALTVTGLLIYSLISVAVEERVREYAILRTLGARPRYIFQLVLTESFLLCFVGVVPGVLAGAGFAAGLLKLANLAMGAKGGAIALDIGWRTLVLTLAGGVVLSLGSALLPAMKATRWRIVDALDPLRRGQIAEQPGRGETLHRPFLLGGLAVSALAVVVFFVLPSALLSGNPSLIGTIVLCLLVAMVFGFTLAAVGLLPVAERLILGILGGLLGPSAELTGRNLQRHRRRHLTTALLFTLSVSLVVFVASLVALASRTAFALVERTHGADLRLHAYQDYGGSLKEELLRIAGVAAVSEVRFLNNRPESGIAYDVVISDLVGMKNLWIVPFGADPALASVLFTNQFVCEAGSLGALPELSRTSVKPGESSPDWEEVAPIILSQAVAQFLNVRVGDPVQLSFRLGSQRTDARFRVTAVFSAVPGLDNFRARVARAVGAGALMSLEKFNELTRAAPAEAFQALYFVKASGTVEEQKSAAQRIREQLDLRFRFGIQSTAEQKQEAQALYWATQILFGFLLGIAVIIAVFALIASMATTVLERRREIGVLKALGMRRSQLFRMFLGEAVVLTLAAGGAGAAIGFALAWFFMLQASLLMELAVVFTVPYITLFATFLISLLAGALAAYLPTRRLLRQSAAEILRG